MRLLGRKDACVCGVLAAAVTVEAVKAMVSAIVVESVAAAIADLLHEQVSKGRIAYTCSTYSRESDWTRYYIYLLRRASCRLA